MTESPLFDLVAVCDVDAGRAKEAAEAAGAKPFTDLAEMLSFKPLETVSVCTASDTHAAVTLAAAGLTVGARPRMSRAVRRRSPATVRWRWQI